MYATDPVEEDLIPPPEDEPCGVMVNLDLPNDIIKFVEKGRESEFGKRVVGAFLESKSDMKVNARDTDSQNFFFLELFGVTGIGYAVYCDNDKYTINGKRVETRWSRLDINATVRNLCKAFSKNFYLKFESSQHVRFWSDGILVAVNMAGINGLYDPSRPDLVEKAVGCIAAVPFDGIKEIEYVVYEHGFQTTRLKVKKQDCDIQSNYNDDLPDDRVVDWINSDDSGVVVFHGEPGTGKTSYIRNLIYKTDNRFLFFDKSIFQHMSDSSLIELLLNHRNSIIILEDCEDLLTNRTGFGSCMGTILNLTDGILGDSMKFKFICTFNADIVDIDPAILRKGRMRLKYEFKKLAGKKAKALGEKLGVQGVPEKDMPLCEVYNYLVDNGNTKKESSKVGF